MTSHFCGFQDFVCVDLSRSQCGSRIRCEKRIPGSGTKDNDATLFQMANRPPTDIRLCHFLVTQKRVRHLQTRRLSAYPYLNSCLQSGLHIKALEHRLQTDRIHCGRQHADVIGCGPVDSFERMFSSKEVSTPNDNGDLVSFFPTLSNLF